MKHFCQNRRKRSFSKVSYLLRFPLGTKDHLYLSVFYPSRHKVPLLLLDILPVGDYSLIGIFFVVEKQALNQLVLFAVYVESQGIFGRFKAAG